MAWDDQAGVEQFCRNVRPRLVGALSLLCGDAAVAEELAQDTLGRVVLHWPSIRDLGEPQASAWAYRVAVNLGNSWIRRKGAERRALNRLGSQTSRQHPAPEPADVVAVRHAVATLPRRQRTALVLRYYTDLPVDEVAELMGCAPGTVKALTNRAITALRHDIADIAAPTVTEVPHGR